jgi:tetratricopeptide (TPR) repeat protein
MVHADRLEWEEADDAYSQALHLSEQTGNRELIGMVMMNRSELSCAMGRYDEAIERCDAALALFSEIGAEILRGTTLRWKGRALRELGQYQLAERALIECMRIAHRAQAALLETESMQELGSLLSVSGNSAGAKRWLTRALDGFEKLGAAREAEEVRADLSALD